MEDEKGRTQRLIRKYKTREYRSKHFRTKLRNEIHGLMHTKVLGYVKGVLAKWHRYEDEPKLVSLSWDAFMFCLDRYDDEKYDVYGHFNTYVRYFLLLHYGREDRELDREVFMDDVKDIIPALKTGDPAAALTKLVELKSFRDSLTQEHQRRIFDHVVVGSHVEMFANLKSDRGGITCYRYYKNYGMKEAFRAIVDHILREGKE